MPTIIPTLLLLSGCLGLQSLNLGDSGTGALDDTGPGSASFGGMVYPTSLDFGEVLVGDSEVIDVVLLNDGGNNLTLDQLILDAPTSYSIEANAVPWVIGAGGEFIVTLTFFPTTAGVAEGSLSFGIEGVDGLAEIPLSGQGVDESGDGGATGDGGGIGDGGGGGDGGTSTGALSYSTTTLDFGLVTVGSLDSANVIITNDSSTAVQINSITTSDAVITTTGIATPTTIGGSSSATLQVHFAPTEGRVYSETVTIGTDEGNTTISVTGEGDDSCTICAPIITVDTGGSSTSMDFVSVYGIPDTQSVRISNVGDQDLEIRDIYVTNEDVGAGSFSVSGTTSGTVAPGGGTSFSVTYTCPDLACLDLPSTDLDWNILHIESNDPSNPDWQISLNGI